jgi:hypothetical protein
MNRTISTRQLLVLKALKATVKSYSFWVLIALAR